MNERTLLRVNNLQVQLGGKAVLSGLSFDIREGSCWAITGESGSGKTTLLRALAGRVHASGEISFGHAAGQKPSLHLIEQQHVFRNLSHTATFYYQQRFNSADAGDAQPVAEMLQETCAGSDRIAAVLELLQISHLGEAPLIQLSNGEHKRLQLAKALLEGASWLLLDNPYTGLDVSARAMLGSLLATMLEKGMNLLLVTSPEELPCFVSDVIFLRRDQTYETMGRKAFDNRLAREKRHPRFSLDSSSFEGIKGAYPQEDFSVAIRMVDTSVVYDGRKILDRVNWQVNRGERWNVSGPNGSGKSTLLSLVTGDNPQAFASEIYLFDRRKGSGESIWDIKRKIGFLSPELHHYFDSAESCFHIVASGLFDTIGLFRRLDEKQRSIVRQWLVLLRIDHLEDRAFNRLSNGEQRLVLLARSLVKNPPLLVLDEPCQGLDTPSGAACVALIDEICIKLNKTLIYVSHYEQEIPSCVTRTLKLAAGRVAA